MSRQPLVAGKILTIPAPAVFSGCGSGRVTSFNIFQSSEVWINEAPQPHGVKLSPHFRPVKVGDTLIKETQKSFGFIKFSNYLCSPKPYTASEKFICLNPIDLGGGFYMPKNF